MNKKRPPLIFEQLEERIFLDANPLLILDPTLDPGGDMGGEIVDVPLESAAETAAAEPEKSGDGAEGANEEAEGETSEKSEPNTSSETAPEDSDSESSPDESRSTGDPENEAELSSDSSEDAGPEESVSEPPEETVAGQSTENDSEKSPNPIIEEAADPLLSELMTIEGHQADSTESDTGDEIVGSDSEITVEGGEDGDSLSEDSFDAGLQSGLMDSANGPIVLEPVDPLINEDFTFTYSFQNVIGQTGYGPHVDIYFPTNGIQGDYPDPQPAPPPVSDIYDGIRFVSATYEGQALDFLEQRFDATGQIEHPYAKDSSGSPVIVNGSEGDTFVSILLPFGSYTPLQPAADVVVTAHMSNLAEVDQLFDVTTSSGFRFGFDSVDNPQSDPSVPNQGPVTTPYLAEVVRYNKSNTASEGETPTGPNFTQSYQIVIDVANQMTVENLVIVETLPDNIVFIPGSVSGSLVQGSTLVGNELTIELGDVTGVLGPDTTVTFDFFVPDILEQCDPSEPVINNMRLEADWDPFDDRDPFVQLVIDFEVNDDGTINPGPDDVLEAQAITIEKSASDLNGGGYAPGDIVEYTLDFEVSDYHALGQIEITDIMPDGMMFYEDATYQANFNIRDQYGTYIGDFTVGFGQEIELTPRPDLSDATQIDIHVSEALERAGDADGILEGGRTNLTTGGPALGTITYYGLIKDEFISPNVPIYQGDSLNNSVTISAARYGYPGLDEATGTPGTLFPFVPICTIDNADDSSGTVTIPVGGIEKEVYALNGTTVSPGSTVTVRPGDEVTFRLTYTLPTADLADLVFQDYLPLPIFDVDDPDSDGTDNGWTTQFTAADINGTAPAAGFTKFGPSETFFPYSGLAPAVSTNSGQNELIYDWEDNFNPLHEGQTVDILFTVTVSTDPFADGLFLTNLVQGTETGNDGSTSSTDIAQVILAEPDLEITKGVIQVSDLGQTDATFTDATGPVTFTDPGTAGFRANGNITESGIDPTTGSPIDADLEFIDGADLVTFAITIQNVGHFFAYDVTVDDDIPAGFAIPSAAQSPQELNLSVTDGAGTSFNFEDGAGNAYGDPGFDFFANGIKILDPLGANVDSNTSQTDNILFITYDLIADETVEPQQTMINTGVLANYASVVDGPNFVPDGLEDQASVNVTEPDFTKELVGSEIGDTLTGGDPDNGINEKFEAVIGERVYYEARILLKEGSTNSVVLIDEFDKGLELVSIDSITVEDQNGNGRPGLVNSSLWGDDFSTFAPILAPSAQLSYTESESGTSNFSLQLGDLTNTDNDNLTDEIIVVGYTAMAVNDADNLQGEARTNSATIEYQVLPPSDPPTDPPTNVPGTGSVGPVSADPVTIIEPNLTAIKTAVVAGVPSGPPAQEDDPNNPDTVPGQQNDPVTYTIVIEHRDPSGATAYDVELFDLIPIEVFSLNLDSAVHSSLGDIAGVNIFLDGRTLSTNDGTQDTPFDLAFGDTVTITVSGNLSPILIGGLDILNEAEIEWTSYDNPVNGSAQPVGSGFVATNDVERTGDPADPGQLNDYNDIDPVLITVNPETNKFLVNSELSTEPDATDDGQLARPDDSDGINDGREAVIGELLYYQVDIAIPEAVFFNVTLTDRLDAGLALVSIDNIARSDDQILIENDELVLRDWTTSPYDNPADPLNTLIDYTYSSGGSRDQLVIDFGNIGNLVDDDDVDFITISYTVMVTDITQNSGEGLGTQGTRLNNAAELEFGFTATGARTTVPIAKADNVEIIEPELVITKDAATYTVYDPANPANNVTAPDDAGDIVVYTFTVEHTGLSEADAYDLGLTDTFDSLLASADLTVVSAEIARQGGATEDVSGAFSFSGSDLVTAPGAIDLFFGESLELVISTTIVDDVYPADEISNRVDLIWSSLDGDITDISNFVTDADENKERTDPEYAAFAEAPIITVLDPVVDKRLVSTDVNEPEAGGNGPLDATIGEILTYELTLTLPEGRLDNVELIDTLSPGLEIEDIINGISISAAPGSDISTSLGDFDDVVITPGGDPGGSGRTISFNFGNLTIAGDNDGNFDNPLDPDQGDDRIVIQYQVFVLDDLALNDAIGGSGTTFDNSASLSYDNRTETVATDPVDGDDVTLVEPDLEIVKTVNGLPDGTDLTDADAGDLIAYEIEVSHTGASGSGAYDLFLDDDLPDQIITPGVTNVATGGGLTLVGADFEIVNQGGDLFLQFSSGGPNTSGSRTIDLFTGQSFTVTVTGSLTDTVQPNELIPNLAEIEWTSLPEGHPNDNGGDNTNNDQFNERVYQDDDDANILIGTPDINKGGGGTHTIGEQTTFNVAVTLPEGEIEDLIITDALPDGLLVEDPADVVISDLLFNGSYDDPLITINGGDGNDIIIDFSNPTNDPAKSNVITVFADNNPLNNELFFLITARVLNEAPNVDGTILVNSAELTYNDANDVIQTVGPDDAAVALVEPQITTEKSVVDESGDQTVSALGEIVTYTARFTNTGNSTAYEVEVFDLMAPGTVYVDLTSATYFDTSLSTSNSILGTTFDTYDPVLETIEFGSTDGDSWDVEAGDYIEIVYTAQVLGAWFVPGPHTNVIDADWTGLDGDTNPEERIYDDTSDRNPGMSQDGLQDTSLATYYVPQGQASIGDFVWFDADQDGVQDLGEGGIANVTVTTEVDVGGGVLYTATAVTDANGLYMFSNLQAATYQVTVDTATLPPDMDPTYDLDSGTVNPDNTTSVVLATDEMRDDVDFGYFSTAEGVIGDYIWYDVNRDGIQDPTEIGIPNALVRLEGDINNNGNFDYVTLALTDASGIYNFTNLPYVDYIITVVGNPYGINVQTFDPDGTLDNMSATTLVDADGQREDLDLDFGYVGNGQIGDILWDDLNANGIEDPGETGLLPGGVELTLEGDFDRDGAVDFTQTTTTSATDGSYLFDGLPTGFAGPFTNIGTFYTIRVNPATLPPDYIQSGDPDGVLDNQSELTLNSFQPINLDQDFGYTRVGSLGDTVWLDINGDGIEDVGEPGIAGVSVTITGDWNLDGVIDTDTTVTDGTGFYEFLGLPLGTYTVEVDPATLPLGVTPTYDLDGIGTPNITDVDLGYDEDRDDVDFGYSGTGSIGDRLWYDMNQDGVQDDGTLDDAEPGISGVEITLNGTVSGITNPVVLTTTTGADGLYSFGNLPLGTYTISVTGTLPYGLTVPTYDRDGGTASPDGSTTVDLPLIGEPDPLNPVTVDFGYAGAGQIGDTIWHDLNGDGAPPDPGEPALAGVEVTLVGSVGPLVPDFTRTITTSGAIPNYSFDGLPFGSYTITIDESTIPLTNFIQSWHPDGRAVKSNISTTQLTIGAPSDLDQDFAYAEPGSIGDLVWYNFIVEDAVQDPGEPGIPGVTVELSGDVDLDGTTDTLTATTDADGLYLFDNIGPGPYTITVTPPPGWTPNYDFDGGNDNTSQYDLTSGETQLDQDFGYIGTGSVGDRVWFDVNQDGVQDPPAFEPGIPTVEVTLEGDIDGDGVFDFTIVDITDADGLYLFENLPSVNYVVTVDPTTIPFAFARIATYDYDGGLDHTTSFSLPLLGDPAIADPENPRVIDFGYASSGTIGDFIWDDRNSNGRFDPGEPGIDGVRVILLGDPNRDGVIDFVQETTTAATAIPTANYLFTGLPSGDYTVIVDTSTLPAGYIQSFDPEGPVGKDNRSQLSLSIFMQSDLDRDFGYTRTGSIGDFIWYDVDGDGVQDPGEPGIPGVSVILEGDVNLDGRAEVLTEITDSSGKYLFTEIPAGTYSITVDLSTVPPEFVQTFDPDGLLDSMTIVTLGVGENNLAQDFGYTIPPDPPQPPKPPKPPLPPQPPEPQVPEPGDPLLAFQFSESAADQLVFPDSELRERVEPPVPISPIYTGVVEPGTTVNLTLRDSTGDVVATHMVIAGPAGNWLSGLEGILLYDTTHDITIDLDASLYNNSSPGLFNTRIYFNPTMIGLSSSTTSLDPEAIFGSTAEHSLRSISQWNNSLFDLEWDKFSGYEFFSPSINPAQHKR